MRFTLLPCALLLAPLTPALATDGFTELVSLSTTNAQGNGASGTGQNQAVAISANGRAVAFLSVADNLVPGDTNGRRDAFLRDLDLGLIERVSLSSAGVEVDQDVTGVATCGSGRFVAFTTAATTLSSQDQNGFEDVYLRDRLTGTTTLVSRTPGGQAGNGPSGVTNLSSDGRYVCFGSAASDLVPGDTNGAADVFVYDRITQGVERVSVDTGGGQGNNFSYSGNISANGRYVAFVTRATNLAGSGNTPFDDILVRDRQTGVTQRITPGGLFGLAWNDHPGRPSISNTGRYVAFQTDASNVVPGDDNGTTDVFVWDRDQNLAIPISVALGSGMGNGPSDRPQISVDGNFVIFQSAATDLVPGDTNGWIDIFRARISTGAIERVSVSTQGTQANSLSGHPAISGNGARVAFTSIASNLVAGDTNLSYDVFARLLGALPTLNYCSVGPNSLDCGSATFATGQPSAKAGSGFELGGVGLISQQFNMVIYSTAGPAELPFATDQVLCLAFPIVRTPVQATGGSPIPDCSGYLSFDFNAWIAAGQDPALQAGTPVWAQVWIRDPLAPGDMHLTPGLQFVIGP